MGKGYFRVMEVNFGEIFSPIANLTSIRTLMYIVVEYDLEMAQLDVKKTFIHDD